MGYYDDDGEPAAEQGRGALGVTQQILGMLVRLLGLGVLIIGTATAVVVLQECWRLYVDPARIERFAVAIEAGSHLDSAFASTAASLSDVAAPEDSEVAPQGAPATPRPVTGDLRLSYFVAWFITLLVLFILGMLSMSAITTGGQLALYDMQVKRLSRAVMREARNLRRAA